MPIKYLVDEIRDVVPVPRFRDQRVLHYSIPSFDLTGGPTIEEGGTIGSDKLRVRAGDVLISKLNPRKSRVRVVSERRGTLALSSTEFVVLRPRRIGARYLAYLLRSQVVRQGLDSAVRSVTRSQQRVEARDVLRITVPLGDRARQCDVADFLDRECDRVSQLFRRIDLLIHTTEGWLERWVANRLEDRASEQLLLRRVIRNVSDGPFGSSLAAAHYVDAPEVRVIRLGNIGDAEFRDADRAYVSHEYAERHLGEHFVRPGDLVMAGLGDEHHRLGRACLVPAALGPAIHKADCYRVRVDPGRVLANYAAWALSFGPSRQQAELLARGATRARLNTAVARNLPLPWMPLDEQALLVEEAEDRRTRERLLLGRVSVLKERLAEYRDALITEAVTGQLDVTRLSDSQLDESAHAAMEGERPEVLSA